MALSFVQTEKVQKSFKSMSIEEIVYSDWKFKIVLSLKDGE